jgi:hypothetical protein
MPIEVNAFFTYPILNPCFFNAVLNLPKSNYPVKLSSALDKASSTPKAVF